MRRLNRKDFTLKGDPLPITNVYPFRFGIISDLQIGEQFALFPPDFRDEYGTGYELNEGQKIIWEYLNKYIEKLNEYKISCLLVVGDLISGKNPKEAGTYMMNVELPIQKEACAAVLAYICEKVPTIQRIYVWRGTPYHGSRDVKIEEDIVRILIADYGINAYYSGPFSYLTLEHKNRKKILFVTHPTSDAWMYIEQAMGRNIMFFQQAAAEGKVPYVDMIISGHKHSYIEVHKSHIRSILLPCWQFFVPYDKAMKYYPKWQPDIGGVILLADEELRLRSWHFIYPNVIDPERFLVVKAGSKEIKETDLS